MKQTPAIIDVAIIVRQFLQTEARTYAVSKGKMLKDEDVERLEPQYLQVG